MCFFTKYGVVLGLFSLILSCSTPKDVLIDQNLSSKTETSVIVNGHSIKKNVLTLNVVYKGCKKDTLQLVTNGIYKKTNPPSIKLLLTHKSCCENCSKSISKNLKFDLSNLQLENTDEENKLILTIDNYPTSIEYVY